MASRQVECNNKRQTISIKLIVCLLHYEGQSKAVTVKMGFSKGLAQKPRQVSPPVSWERPGALGQSHCEKLPTAVNPNPFAKTVCTNSA